MLKRNDIVVLPPSGAGFIRGDANRDGRLDISDPIHILGFLFSNGILICQDAGDVDDSGQHDLADPIYLLMHLFVDGPDPKPPFPEPGIDATDDDPFTCEW